MTAQAASREAATARLRGLEILEDTFGESLPGGRFRPTDPADEARARAVPTGLVQDEPEDAAGLEHPGDFSEVTVDLPITGVDAGVVRLGDTEDGTVAIVRAAAVTYHPDGRVVIQTFRPGPVLVNSRNALGLFHGMGAALGKPAFYVALDDNGVPTELKTRLSPHDHRVIDRLRNYVERLVQRYVVDQGEARILLVDGALTLRTYDTPGPFLQRLGDDAEEVDISLVAVAKKTGLTVRGADITTLLDDGGRRMRRKITRAVKAEGLSDRFLGDLYVARFAPGCEVYRVDVAPSQGLRSTFVLDQVFTGCRFRSGYPEPLLMAHIASYMPPPIVAELQAHVVGTHGLVIKPEVNLGPIFAPFGGRWK